LVNCDSTNRKQTRGIKTRKKIIRVAKDLFIKQGFNATTTRQITTKAGIAVGLIYNHFKSKADIFEEVIKEFHPWRSIPKVLRVSDGENVEEFVRNASKLMLSEWNKDPGIIRLHLIEILEFNNEHLPFLFKEIFSDATEITRQFLINKPNFTSINPDLLSRALLGLFFGHLMTDTGSTEIRNGVDTGGFDYFADAYLRSVFTTD